MPDPTLLRQKRLLHRSRYRGSLESDLLLGRFAQAHLASFGPDEVDCFEALLDESDQDILAWVMGRAPVPQRHDNVVMVKLRGFDPSSGGAPGSGP